MVTMTDPVNNSSSTSGSSSEPAPIGSSGPEGSPSSEMSFIDQLKNTTITNPSTGEEINAFDAFIMNLAMNVSQNMQEQSAKVNQAMKEAGESKG